jgi:hypothetical protein
MHVFAIRRADVDAISVVRSKCIAVGVRVGHFLLVEFTFYVCVLVRACMCILICKPVCI